MTEPSAKALAAILRGTRNGMHDQINTNAAQIQQITSSAGPTGLTDAEKDALHRLFALRRDLDQSIIAYSIADSIDLNNSAEVRQLAATIANVNLTLKHSLEQVNKVVTTTQNIAGLMKTLDSALKAVSAFAAII
jgi:hypothetical protein